MFSIYIFSHIVVSFKVCNVSQGVCSTSYKDNSLKKKKYSLQPFATEPSGDCGDIRVTKVSALDTLSILTFLLPALNPIFSLH